MKHLIVMLFALSLIGCGGGGSGGGGGSANMAQLPNTNNPNTDGNGGEGDKKGDGDNNGGNTPTPTITTVPLPANIPNLVAINNNNWRLDYVDDAGNNKTINIHFPETQIIQAAVTKVKNINSRNISNVTRIPIDANFILNLQKDDPNGELPPPFQNNSLNDYLDTHRGYTVDLPNNLTVKYGSVKHIKYKAIGSDIYTFNAPFFFTVGDTIRGLPSGTHHYGGVLSRNIQGLGTRNSYYVTNTSINLNGNVGSGFPTDFGHISITANFDEMTGTIDNRKLILNGSTIDATQNNIPPLDKTDSIIVGNFNINPSDGSFTGSGKLTWNDFKRSGLQTIDVDATTTIKGSFHGNEAEGISGIYYTDWETYSQAVEHSIPQNLQFTGAFVAKKR